ncbi:two-component system sensor histidine kinase DesK [Kribbella amoyensis]|uniref:Two-component system sensor histidine kinase DesK n=1 Tax=Kribbella amoyensis TaxID=996641 RepID=A0A561B2S4_9ACTN|nr:histidine kinase [Kribbella amoyensis]TWD73158.1 two-component system sensor histidine kinase DesK [Kribbella amoyensis]
MSPDRAPGTAISPRLVVLGLLLISYAWALVFPLRLTQPPTTVLSTAYVVGLALFGAALTLVLVAAVTPERSPRAWLKLIGVLVAVSLVLWLPAYEWAEAGQEPWAWLAGFAIGASALADPRAGGGAAVVLVGAAVLGAVVHDGSVVANLAIVVGCAVTVWLMGLVLVWLLRLIWAAEAGREAEAGLVLAEERLRMSRELHDVLGHRLGIIAVKAELAAELARTEPERAAEESAEIRAIAADTLGEARRAVHGETVADLATQLASAELVLRSAGIETAIDVDSTLVPLTESTLLAAVVREAVTNILRHSDARSVRVTFDAATLLIVNDGVRSGPSGAGTGLGSLAARCASTGCRLSAGPVGDGSFEVKVELR